LTDLVFFYGTLMSGFKRPGRSRIDPVLQPEGRGSIHGTLFDLGIYPAAIPSTEGRVWGEVHRMLDPDAVLAELDEIEGFRASQPEASLFTRASRLPSRSMTAMWRPRGRTSTTRRSVARSESNPATTSSI